MGQAEQETHRRKSKMPEQRSSMPPEDPLPGPTAAKTGPKPRSVAERLQGKYRLESGCFIWTGSYDSRGRPAMQSGSLSDGTRRPRRVHRLLWVEAYGPVPEGFDIHHQCHDKRCVNIDHLELLSHEEHAKHHTSDDLPWRGYGLHIRWHVNRGLVNESCSYCTEGESK